MSDEPDPERLRALDARLSKVKATQAAPSRAGKDFSQGELAWRMVVELVSGMLLGLAIGYGLDHVFGTRPIFLVIFVLLGFAAGIRTVIGTANEAGRKAQKAQAEQMQADDPARNEGR